MDLRTIKETLRKMVEENKVDKFTADVVWRELLLTNVDWIKDLQKKYEDTSKNIRS